jgi:hypothetical protein
LYNVRRGAQPLADVLQQIGPRRLRFVILRRMLWIVFFW